MRGPLPRALVAFMLVSLLLSAAGPPLAEGGASPVEEGPAADFVPYLPAFGSSSLPQNSGKGHTPTASPNQTTTPGPARGAEGGTLDAPNSPWVWTIETAEMAKPVHGAGQRNLALDTGGNPHIAYGGTRLFYAWSDGIDWHQDTVDDNLWVGGYASLVLDESDHPHISYYDDRLDAVKYAYFDGAEWEIQTVGSAGDTNIDSSLALDTSGHPHISYHNGSAGALKYAYYDGTTWQRQTVDSGLGSWGSTCLALDGHDHPHISYRDYTNTALKYAYHDGIIWHVEEVDASGNAGQSSSLALDVLDRPHISYYGLGGLRYASHNGTNWLIATVDSAGMYTSIALDAAGLPHISYINWSAGDLKYAHYDGTDWLNETVVSGEHMRSGTSIVLDSEDRPHISYGVSDEWRYAHFDGVDWQNEQVDTLEVISGAHTSLVLGATGLPHISHHAASGLKYTYHDGTAWHTERVDGSAGLFSTLGNTSLALDQAGRPHISYCQNVESSSKSLYGRLRYAHHNGTDWFTETLDIFQEVGGGWSSLALDSDGYPHIAYCGPILKYVHLDGMDWITETTDYYCEYLSLALDSNDFPHVAFHADGRLYHASYNGASWISETVDSTPFVGFFPSLKVDTDDRPHISHFEDQHSDLEYAYHDGTGWVTETVDSTDQVGWYTSLALDADDHPHIGYFDRTNENLKYAYYDGSSWHIETVDDAEWTGYYPSLALDSAGRPHISYGEGQYGDLMYASAAECVSVTAALIDGPITLPVGETGAYTASYAPPTATLPVTFTWDNGASGPTAAYSWTQPGVYTLTVTATNPCGEISQTLAVEVFCQPVEGIEIEGPAGLRVGQTGTYTASYTPPTATLPVTFTWDSGASSSTTVYSWPQPGAYTLTVTATNPCGEVSGTLRVEVCQPVEGLAIAGPAGLRVGHSATYSASYTPPTATLPVSFTWDNGASGPTTAYSWPQPGVYTLTVTATNPCGQVTATLSVEVTPFRVYLPIVTKGTVLPPTGRSEKEVGKRRVLAK